MEGSSPEDEMSHAMNEMNTSDDNVQYTETYSIAASGYSLPNIHESVNQNQEWMLPNLSTKLFIGKIPPHVSKQEVYNLFSQFGNVLEIAVLRSSNSFTSENRRNDDSNDHERTQDSTNADEENNDSDTSSQSQYIFSRIQYGFVRFEYVESAIAAVNTLHDTYCFESSVGDNIPPLQVRFAEARVSPRRDTCKLFIGQLPRTLGEEELAVAFSPFGEILRCHILRQADVSRGCGFVQYASKNEADAAIAAMNGACVFEPQRALNVRYAETPHEKNMRKHRTGSPASSVPYYSSNQSSPLSVASPMRPNSSRQHGHPRSSSSGDIKSQQQYRPLNRNTQKYNQSTTRGSTAPAAAAMGYGAMYYSPMYHPMYAGANAIPYGSTASPVAYPMYHIPHHGSPAILYDSTLIHPSMQSPGLQPAAAVAYPSSYPSYNAYPATSMQPAVSSEPPYLALGPNSAYVLQSGEAYTAEQQLYTGNYPISASGTLESLAYENEQDPEKSTGTHTAENKTERVQREQESVEHKEIHTEAE